MGLIDFNAPVQTRDKQPVMIISINYDSDPSEKYVVLGIVSEKDGFMLWDCDGHAFEGDCSNLDLENIP